MNLDPDVLLRFGLSVQVIENQLNITQKLNEIKVDIL